VKYLTVKKCTYNNQNNKLRLGNSKMFIINGGIYVALTDQKFQCIPKKIHLNYMSECN